jgi:hypothetical protein
MFQILEISHVSETQDKDVTGCCRDLWDVLEAQPLTTPGTIEISIVLHPDDVPSLSCVSLT